MRGFAFLRLKPSLFAFGIGLLVGTPGLANVMTFSGIGSNQVTRTNYTEDGITATSIDGTFWGYPSGQALHLDPSGFSDSTYDFTLSGGLFDLNSLDITCCGTTGAIGNLTAFNASNIAFKTGTFSAATNRQVAFTDWTGISRLRLVDTGGHFSIDNLSLTGTTVTAVPEPATWAMMISGIGLAGGVLRRRAGARVSFA